MNGSGESGRFLMEPAAKLLSAASEEDLQQSISRLAEPQMVATADKLLNTFIAANFTGLEGGRARGGIE